MKKYLTISTIGAILLYSIFAFVKWEFNPNMWGEDLRVTFSLILSTWLVTAGMLAQMPND